MDYREEQVHRNNTTGKITATVVSGAVCIGWMICTGGASGVGWFMFSLLLIW